MALVLGAVVALSACDNPSSDSAAPQPAESGGATAPAAPPPAHPAAPPSPQAPEIIIDHANVAIGNEHVPTGEPALADKVGAALAGKPAIEGQAVDVVAMRNAKPSQVALVLAALRAAKASGATVKTQARDETTQKLPIAFAPTLPDCTVVAWIAKDGMINVWPAGGGTAKRVARGLAGPDMTLGTDAIRAQWGGCAAPVIAAGADDAMTWGLIFDLATSALGAPGSRANAAVLVTSAAPGHKLTLP